MWILSYRKWKQPLLMEMGRRQVILLSLQLVGKMASQSRLFSRHFFPCSGNMCNCCKTSSDWYDIPLMIVDDKLYGWACCWTWIFWSSFPGASLHYRGTNFSEFSNCSQVLDAVIGLSWYHGSVQDPEWCFIEVLQAKCLETGETVAIKKVLQDKRYKNRELQTMRLLDHPNVVSLKHCFFSTTEKDELYLNLVLEYVPETVHRVIKHYSKMNQRMPLIYVKLYFYQVYVDSSSALIPLRNLRKNSWTYIAV